MSCQTTPSELQHAIYLFDISSSCRRLSFVYPSVSAATTTAIFMFHSPRSRCISSSRDREPAAARVLAHTGMLRNSVLPELSDKTQDGCMEQLQNLDLSPMSAVGAALLRFILAGFWIAHWWFKVGYRGMPATEAFFLQQGLPAWLAWFDISFEVVTAVCLILGIFVPLLCVISLPILFASMWIYRRNGFYFSGGGIELPVLWACAQVARMIRSRVLHPMYLSDVSKPLLERFPFEIGTDRRYAFDPAINAETMSSS